MRLILASVAVVILAGAAIIFGWQQSEIMHLRAQVAQQSAARVESRPRRPVADNALGLSADERRFVLGQYQDVLAKMNLPPTKASRLQDLLTKRIEVALDAQEDAEREGFADGSPEMTRAESSAIGGVDQEIAGLLGTPDDRRFVLMTTGAAPQVDVMPAPAPVVVNVINQTPETPVYEETADQSVAADAYVAPAPYYPPAYYYYPYSTVFVGRSFARPLFHRSFDNRSFGGQRFASEQRFAPMRSERPAFGGSVGGARGIRRTR